MGGSERTACHGANIHLDLHSMSVDFFFLFLYVQGHLRHGVVLQAMQLFEKAMVAFAKGLTCEPTNQQLLTLLKEVTLLSPLKGRHSNLEM